MSMNKLYAAAAALTLFAAAAAQAETVERIEVVGQSNGCTTVYQDGATDQGMKVSYVTMSCPKTDSSTQIAQDPANPVEKVAELR